MLDNKTAAISLRNIRQFTVCGHGKTSCWTRCLQVFMSDQLDEIEALKSIYPTEFEEVSMGNPLSYRIHLKPNPSGEGNHGE